MEEDLCEESHDWDSKADDDAERKCLRCGDRLGCAWCGKGLELGCCNDCLSPEAKKLQEQIRKLNDTSCYSKVNPRLEKVLDESI